MADPDPQPADDDDNPEWTEADFARAKPFREVFPEQYKAWKKLGRPPAKRPKLHIGSGSRPMSWKSPPRPA